MLEPLIGTLRESPLHRELKRWYAEPGDLLEANVAGYVVDILKPGSVVEIQTGACPRLRAKLAALLQIVDVKVVLPACVRRWIVKYVPDSEHVTRRRSPKRGAFDDAFVHLVSIAGLLNHPRLSIEVVATEQEEVRCPTTRRRRHAWSTVERRLLSIDELRPVKDPRELFTLLDATIPEHFTAPDLANLLRRPPWHAGKIAYCLRESGAAEVIGKRGRALLYARRS